MRGAFILVLLIGLPAFAEEISDLAFQTYLMQQKMQEFDRQHEALENAAWSVYPGTQNDGCAKATPLTLDGYLSKLSEKGEPYNVVRKKNPEYYIVETPYEGKLDITFWTRKLYDCESNKPAYKRYLKSRTRRVQKEMNALFADFPKSK
jgi:hypothetical protein